MAYGPLHGIRVLDFSQIVAGPYAAANVADLGADVIKVEVVGGDPFRAFGQVTPAGSKGFQSLNRGKRSIVLNLQDERAQAIIHRPTIDTDAVIQNYRTGVAERLRIDYDTLRAIRHDLIYVQNTGFGASGPRRDQASSDLMMQGYSGLIAQEGKLEPSGAPARIASVTLVDYLAGQAMAMGLCAALFHRERTGEGQMIHTSLLAAGLTFQHGAVMREPVTDAVIREPLLADMGRMRAEGASYAQLIARYVQRRRSASAQSLYYTTYAARDGGLVFGALTRANRQVMRKVLGITGDPTDDDDYDPSDPANITVADHWRDEIQRILLTRTVAEWVADFDALGAPVAAVNFPEEMADDPQVQALDIMTDLEHAQTGPQKMVGPILKMSATPPAIPRPAPPLGGHTDEILAAVGYTAAEIEELREAGVVG